MIRPGRKFNRNGYTLLAVIGLVGVMTILAGIILPDMIVVTKIDKSGIDKDQLLELGLGLEREIVLNKSIPDQTNWAAQIANNINPSVNKVQQNEQGNARYYIWDPNSNPNPSDNVGGYVQDTALADGLNLGAGEVRPRIVIVSSVGTQPVKYASGTDLASGEAPGEGDFNELWDWDGQSAVLDLTAGQAQSELNVQRIDTDYLFYTILLKNDSESSINITGNAFYPNDSAENAQRNFFNLPAYITVTGMTLTYDQMGCSNCCGSGSDDIDSVDLDIGLSGGAQFFGDINVAVCASPPCKSTSTADSFTIDAGGDTVTSVIADTGCSDGSSPGDTDDGSGYLTVTVTYDVNVSYEVEATGSVDLAAGDNITLYVIQGSKITLYDRAGAPGLVSYIMFANNSDSFRFFPGTSSWMRSGLEF